MRDAGAGQCDLRGERQAHPQAADRRAGALGVERASVSDTAPIVFVVEDDPAMRALLEAMIGRAGWRAEAFATAPEFLAYPRVFVPSCMVLDVGLPGLSGLELQKRIAAERIELPIIFITGRGDVAMTVQAMKAGALEFLTKPFRSEVLMGAIAQAIERSRSALRQAAEMRSLQGAYAS